MPKAVGELGDILRTQRTKLGISMAEVERQTRIRGKLLEAIEAGEYGRLPNPGYVRGYISSYARYLGLDPVPLIDMFQKETGRESVIHKIEVAGEAVPTSRGAHELPWKVAVAAALIIIVVALGLWLVFGSPAESNGTLPVPNGTSQDATSAAGTPATPGVVTAETLPFTLSVDVAKGSASAATVVVDGLEAYNGTLTGQTKEFQVTQSATVTAGTPKAVTVKRDGAEQPFPSGSPASITLKADKAE